MASIPQIEQYLAANPELAARIKQQMEEAMNAMLTKGNPAASAAASSAAVIRAQELMSMLSQQSLAALTQSSSLALLDRERQRDQREREREQIRIERENLNNGNGSAATAAIREVSTPNNSANVSVSQTQQLAAQQATFNSLAEPLGNGIYLATSTHVQQGFASAAPPTMIVPPTHIPLYPGYAQVPGGPGYVAGSSLPKYAQLLAVIEEMSKDLRPTYSGSKTAQDRFKRGIAQARILLRECMHETNQSSASSRN